jgi:hypothetical protein
MNKTHIQLKIPVHQALDAYKSLIYTTTGFKLDFSDVIKLLLIQADSKVNLEALEKVNANM